MLLWYMGYDTGAQAGEDGSSPSQAGEDGSSPSRGFTEFFLRVNIAL